MSDLLVQFFTFSLTVLYVLSIEDIPSPKLDDPFHVIWQMPSGVWCPQPKIGVQYADVLDKSGITWNEDDVWHKGEYSTIFYRSVYGSWPHYLHGKEPPLNGGIPQLGNLTAHLEGIREAIETAIPKTDYHGVVCINMEQFRPLWSRNWGRKVVYRKKSIELVENTYAHINPNEEWIEKEAVRQFEYHAMKYMSESLRLSREMRPNAKWGYYNYPYCYNGSPITLHCREIVRKGNDKMRWLWEASSALMPSTYVHSEYHNDSEVAKFMYGNIEEGNHCRGRQEVLRHRVRMSILILIPGRRVADMVGGRPVYSYHKLMWNGSRPLTFYRQVTMLNGLRLPADFGIEGVILWGSSGYLRTKKECSQISDYVRDVVAPYTASLIQFTRLCSTKRCSGHGRCVHRGTVDERYVDEVLRTTMEELTDWTIDERYSCRCHPGYSGDECEVGGSDTSQCNRLTTSFFLIAIILLRVLSTNVLLL